MHQAKIMFTGYRRVINACSFGSIVINGKKYTSDIIIYPEERVTGPWIRNKGHMLSSYDICELIESGAEVIIAGTGMNGQVRPEKDLEDLLSQKGIKFIPAPNREAIELYNELLPKVRVGACFHLTC